MPSPFPGMDPYLEGYLWPDVHHALANKIRQQLAPVLRPKYAARLEVYLAEDPFPEGEIGILYPDVEVVETSQPAPRFEPQPGDSPAETLSPSERLSPSETLRERERDRPAIALTPPTLALPVVQAARARLASVEIRDVARNRLVASLEILSPVNEREPGLTTYRRQRQRLYQADVHLLELDLLRRGTRPFAHPRLPEVPYCIALTRARDRKTDLWPIALDSSLPVVPVPLVAPDPDVPLDLQAAIAAIYDEAAYDLSLDYDRPPPPPALSEPEAAWLRSRLGRSDIAPEENDPGATSGGP